MKTARRVVFVDEGTIDVVQVAHALSALGVAWSHHFENTWLLVDPEEREARWWREWFAARGAPRVVVIGVDFGDWAANMSDDGLRWLRGKWVS